MIAEYWRRFWDWKAASRRNTVVFWFGVVLADVLLGAAIAQFLVSGISSPGQQSAVARLEPIRSVEVFRDSSAKPATLDQPRGMASQKAGIALLAVGQVEKVKTGKSVRRAQEGTRLVAFRVGDWACEVEPCSPWRSLDPQVVIDGVRKSLPSGGSTFVVVIPPGAGSVDLTIEADDIEQTLSLLDDTAGDGNIAFLAKEKRGGKVQLGERFQVGERTSTPVDAGLGAPTDTLTRDVTLDYAERRFFLNGQVPSSPRKVFLIVNAYYAYVGNPRFYGFSLSEVTFVDDAGHRYPARDLDPSPDKSLLGFEVPADVTSGDFVLGGSQDLLSPNGSTYTSTLGDKQVPIHVG